VASDRDDVRRQFDAVVNMTPKELEKWLETDESRAAGWKDGGGESADDEEHSKWRYSLMNCGHDPLKAG
jgi:hypothetical protein